MTNESVPHAAPRLDEAELFAFRIDFVRRAILLLNLPPEKLREAVFLDDRILGDKIQGGWVALDQFLAAPASDDFAPVNFVFHISHCGSSLLSRMIDEATGALGLREPLPLRDLALAYDGLGETNALFSEESFDRLLAAFLNNWRRRRKFSDGSLTRDIHIKPTSSAQRLAPALFRHLPEAKAITLYVSAKNHIATLLAGPNNIFDMRMWGQERMARLSRLAGPPPTPFNALSPGELAALTWAAERATQINFAAGDALRGRLMDVNFDELLDTPSEILARVCEHFDLTAAPEYLSGLLSAPILKKYAKAPEHEYSPSLRAEILANARREYAAEIAKGLDWLKAYAGVAPPAIAKLFQEGIDSD